ncbi:STAS/SEC14 domain-containing protein [Rufibacter roseolus]|uniref:STAS/SEC14 domain-containing protein n=1 Tax=Rufibacter roseolus TaxID=2817375 RepID=UPI001B30EA93|nr:STAS/SEC14 domain-containing protein [Rufibacter roseolus]
MNTNQVDTSLQAVVATYNGFLKHPEFKEIAEGSLQLIKESGFSKILVDTRQTRVIQKESQEWIDRDWFPRAIRAGVKQMAFLTPDDFFGKMSVEATNKQAVLVGEIDIQYFTSINAAKRWLLSKNGH